MSDIHDHIHKAHLKGRRAEEIPSRRWPVVSKLALFDLQLTGDAPKDWNPIVHATARGYVYLVNVELSLIRLSRSSEHGTIASRAATLLREIQFIKKKWPITLV